MTHGEMFETILLITFLLLATAAIAIAYTI